MMGNPVFCAFDTTDIRVATCLAGQLAGLVGGIKIGLEFHTANGAQGVRDIAACGLPLFLDLKFHDIPNTVAGAIRSACRLAPAMTTLHASGGSAMMRAAVDTAGNESAKLGIPRPKILAVTVLTSMGEDDLSSVGVSTPVLDQVKRLAELAQASGVDGIVCSAHEVEPLRQELDSSMLLVVPGIRPFWAASNDQKRVLGPAEAISKGANILVIGRPITAAADPAGAARRILDELRNML